MEEAARGRAEAEAKLCELQNVSPFESEASAAPGPPPPEASPAGPTPPVAIPRSPPRTGTVVPSGVRGRTGHEVDVEGGEGRPLLPDPDSDDDNAPRGFRPLVGMALMRTAPPRLAGAARLADRATLAAGRALTGQPALRLGAIGYLVVLHLMLALAQSTCHRMGLL